MERACAACGGPRCADNFRGLTKHVDNTAGDEDLEEAIELCPGNCVYNYELAAHWTTEDPDVPPPPLILATLKLSDSSIVLYSLGCTSADLRADLPGLCLPASAKLIVAPGVEAALVLVYGECGK